MIGAQAHEVWNAVLIALAVLLSGGAVRFAGKWFVKALGREFRDAVTQITDPALAPVKESIAAMRQEQTEQHGEVRAEVARVHTRLDEATDRFDKHISTVHRRIDAVESKITGASQ